MKKLLFFLPLMAIFGKPLIAQEIEKISFETEEGFTVGALNDQNDWMVYGAEEDHTFVTADQASDGTQSVVTLGSEDFEFKGFAKSIDLLRNGKVSLDVKIDTEITSEILFDVVNLEQELNVSINFGMDGTLWTGMGGMLTQHEDVTFVADQWYKLTFELDQENQKIILYFDDEILNEIDIDADFGIDALDFYMLDIGKGFYVDNIQIEEIEDLGLSNSILTKTTIYPNPTNSLINISSQDKVELAEIFDLNGKLILKSNQKQIDVSNLSKGTYIIRCKTNGKIHSSKFIKN